VSDYLSVQGTMNYIIFPASQTGGNIVTDFELPKGMAGFVDHIGIAVVNLDESLKLYRDLLGLELESMETVEREQVKVAMLKIDRSGGHGHIELLEPMSSESNIGKFIEKKGAGMHHIAFRAENINDAIEACKEAGLKMLSEEPASGAHNKKVIFAHPKTTGGVLLEICAI
jgi:methylmalonyl-CoA/ethylmalonyl-CoA epimerase